MNNHHENLELRVVIPLTGFPAYILNECAESGYFGRTREDIFETMLRRWYEDNIDFLDIKHGINREDSDRLGYTPFRAWTNKDVDNQRKERLRKLDTTKTSFDLDLSLIGMQAYLVDKISKSGIYPEVSSPESTIRMMILDWYTRESKLLRDLGITRTEAKNKGYFKI